MKPYYERDGITIYHGDCREVLPTIETASVDLVLTDPPYGIALDTDYASGKLRNGAVHIAVYGDDEPFDPTPLLRFRRLILWGANCYANLLPQSTKWIAWDKVLRNDLNLRIGEHELAWTNCVGRSRMFRHLWSGGYRASEQHTALHPCQKPVALMQWCIQLVPEVQTVLDPYMGSGPVLRAAKTLGRSAIGIEIEERYCEIAARRLQQDVLPLFDAAEVPA
jgi:DNA modification methylase